MPPKPLQGQDLWPLGSQGLKAAHQEAAGGSGQCCGGEIRGPGPGGIATPTSSVLPCRCLCVHEKGEAILSCVIKLGVLS